MLAFSEIRKGRVVVFEGEPYVVSAADFLRKQQRRPVMRTTLKNIRTGQTKNHTFQQSDRVEEAAIDHKTFQFLYIEGSTFFFMDGTTYDQLAIEKNIVGSAAEFLKEGQEVNVVMFEHRPVIVELPIKIERKVTNAPPGVKGNTSTNVMKDVVIEGGVTVKAPLFIEEGDVIRIDTRTGHYVERA